MARLLALLMVSIPLLVLSGCTKAVFMPYHSTAQIPYHAASTHTEMTLMSTEQPSRRAPRALPFGVIASEDDGDLPYILLAPARTGTQAVQRLDDANVARSVPLTRMAAEGLIENVDGALRRWGNNPSAVRGTFREFSYAPEQNIGRVSENVEMWRPALRVYYNHTARGPLLNVILGDTSVSYRYELSSRAEVERFLAALRQGLNHRS